MVKKREVIRKPLADIGMMHILEFYQLKVGMFRKIVPAQKDKKSDLERVRRTRNRYA